MVKGDNFKDLFASIKQIKLKTSFLLGTMSVLYLWSPYLSKYLSSRFSTIGLKVSECIVLFMITGLYTWYIKHTSKTYRAMRNRLRTCLCTLVSCSRLFSRKLIFCFCAALPPTSSSSSSSPFFIV